MSIRIDPPVSPAEILREEYLLPLGMSAGALAKRLRVPRTRIERVAKGIHPITSDTALRLAKFFNTTPEFWMNMQAAYDLAVARKTLATELEQIEELSAA
jgi:addiction module HigA family antidote